MKIIWRFTRIFSAYAYRDTSVSRQPASREYWQPPLPSRGTCSWDMFLWTTLPALHVTATPFLLLHGGGRGWEAEGTRGSAVPNALPLSETCLNSPQRLLWVVHTFWFSVVAFSFYTSTVCGLVDPAGIEQLNLHVHFSEKGLCFTTEGSVSFPWLLTNLLHKVKQHCLSKC